MQEFEITLAHMLTFTFVSLFSMVNPIGMAPVFLEKTMAYSLPKRHALAYKVGIYGTVLLVMTLLAGPYVLQLFGLSLADIEIAGGIFVFYSAWQMLTTTPRVLPHGDTDDDGAASDIAFFPLTMPLTAGAGSIAVALSVSSKIVHSGGNIVMGYLGAVIGICLLFIVVTLSYRFSETIFSRIGTAGTAVITRLTAFLLLAIGVAVTWGGLKPLLLSLQS